MGKNILGEWGGGLIFAPIRSSHHLKSIVVGGLLPLMKLDLGKGVHLLSSSQLFKH